MSWRSYKNSHLHNDILTFVFFAMVLVIYRVFNIPCLFYNMTSIPCPACKMTSAFVALAKGDVDAYFAFNAMALPVAAAFAVEMFRGLWGRYQKYLDMFAIVILFINLIYYVYRLY